MNDTLIDMIRISCDECISATDEAQMEYQRGMHEEEMRERAEAWAALEATHGPLMRIGWDYSEYDSSGWKD